MPNFRRVNEILQKATSNSFQIDGKKFEIEGLKKKVVIFDLEGTLTKSMWRDWMRVEKLYPAYNKNIAGDEPNYDMIEVARLLSYYCNVIIVTSRQMKYKEGAFAWIDKKLPFSFIMCVKKDRDEQMTSPEYKELALLDLQKMHNIIYAFDDRQDVCDMYIKNGIETGVVINERH